MNKRKYTKYVKQEDIEKINPLNIELMEKFILGKRNLSDASKSAYTSDLTQFWVYILHNYSNQFLFDMDEDTAAECIDDFISFCISKLENSERRISRRTSSISSLYIFYKKRKKIKYNPIELIERVRAQQGQYVAHHVFLTQEQIELIRKGLEEHPNTQLELYFELALFCMARVTALSSIKIEQIDLEKKVIAGVREKESYIVQLYISDKVKNLIIKWLVERKEKGIESELLFTTRNGRNAKSLFQGAYTQKLGEYAGIDGITAHCLRRSGSSLRKRAGQNLENISKLLNHKSTEVTSKFYIEQDFSELQQDAEQFNI